jgi:hypothetical protein
MPTPIQHLAIAQRLITSDLPPATRRVLEAHWGAHLLGHIAPDAQNKSGQDRAETHFFTLPPKQQRPGHEQIFCTHPALAQASALGPAQAVFVAGYLAHLLLDDLWIRQVFEPYFGTLATWGDLRERLLLHNVLRAWLDQSEMAELSGNESMHLCQAEPNHWLPFMADSALCAWRDEIAAQLQPGATMRTAEVFAARARISVKEFNAFLVTPGGMAQVFAHVPQQHILNFTCPAAEPVGTALAQSRELIIAYLEDRLCT